MFPHHKLEDLNLLIINQTKAGNELQSDFVNIRVINSYEKGLSLSRNLAIKNATGDICLIADDDTEYIPNFENLVKKSFKKLNNAAVILFKIDTFTGEAYKLYPSKSKRLYNNRDIESASSIEIAFNMSLIISNNILFDAHFGLRSYFQSGEEYLFLKEVLKKGLPIYFEDKFIVKHQLIRSTSNIASDDYIKAKAAQYYIDYKKFSYIALLKFIIFLVRKRMVPITDFSLKYKIGLEGIKSYIKLRHAKH
jgi:glycosyltransferase involved in cell wall biosynthesis